MKKTETPTLLPNKFLKIGTFFVCLLLVFSWTFPLSIEAITSNINYVSMTGQQAATLEDLIKARQSGQSGSAPSSSTPVSSASATESAVAETDANTQASVTESQSTPGESATTESESVPMTETENTGTASDSSSVRSVASLQVQKRDWKMVFTESLVYSKNFVAASMNDQQAFTFLLEKNKSESMSLGTYQSLFVAYVSYQKLKDRMEEEVMLLAEDIPTAEEGMSLSQIPASSTLKVKDLFYLLLLDHSAEASEALARLSYENKENFLKEANLLFSKMGLSGTKLVKLYDTDKDPSFSTTEEISYFMSAYLKEDFLRTALTEKEYSFSYLSEGTQKNKTVLSNYFEITKTTTFRGQAHITGGLASWTSNAGYSLLTFAPLGNGYVVAVSARANDNYFRLLDHTGFYASGMNRMHNVSLYAKGERLATIPVVGSLQKQVDFFAEEEYSVKVPEMVGATQITKILNMKERLEAPQNAGDLVGSLQIVFGEEELLNKEYRLKESISLYPLYRFNQFVFALYYTHKGLFYLVMIVLNFALLFAIVLFNYFTRNKKRKA